MRKERKTTNCQRVTFRNSGDLARNSMARSPRLGPPTRAALSGGWMASIE